MVVWAESGAELDPNPGGMVTVEQSTAAAAGDPVSDREEGLLRMAMAAALWLREAVGFTRQGKEKETFYFIYFFKKIN